MRRMIRKAIIVGMTLGVAGSLALYVVSWFVPIDGVKVVVVDDLWIWATAVEGNAIVFVLERNELLDPQEPPRPTNRISHFSFDELRCYSAHVDYALPLRGFRWWTFDFTFPDTTVRTDDEGVACTEHVLVPGRAVHANHIGIPLWRVAILLAAYPAIALIRGPLRRWRRKKRGQCLKCGYDLTGNESGVCPECGTRKVQP